MQARWVQIIVMGDLVARLACGQPAIDLGALDMLACATFSRHDTPPKPLHNHFTWKPLALAVAPNYFVLRPPTRMFNGTLPIAVCTTNRSCKGKAGVNEQNLISVRNGPLNPASRNLTQPINVDLVEATSYLRNSLEWSATNRYCANWLIGARHSPVRFRNNVKTARVYPNAKSPCAT